MNLTFRHSGLQFFFVTLTLEGRPPMLSRLVEGEAHPVLLPAGEVVLAYLRAFHAVYPAVTISDRVIMPDHVHFLMIVRYDQAPGFNPLWASFALMKAIEAAEAQRNGGDAPAPPEAAAHFAGILAHERATAARIERFMRQGLTRAEALARLGALRAQPTPPQGVRGAQPPRPFGAPLRPPRLHRTLLRRAPAQGHSALHPAQPGACPLETPPS